ncbi:BQ2448_3506 [Microbotryum intermedium]|uniref:BQ2448_3506 protein n=1 Tax=Microbotryum intermedium TaxID=269621 RepID=A0A238FFT9_9BASI|nr:BQ2448_3506 [Microbotryum intermedium]
MKSVWAWVRISARHGPAKKPARQRKQGEANRGGRRESKKSGIHQRASIDWLRARIMVQKQRDSGTCSRFLLVSLGAPNGRLQQPLDALAAQTIQ